MFYYILVFTLMSLVKPSVSQDYQVADISCSFSNPSHHNHLDTRERLVAKLRKPPGFKGHPIFADDRRIDPLTDSICQIRPDPHEPTGLIYNLDITDFGRCAALHKDGYVNVRIWFPQLTGVVLATDQEVVIMCQPATPTIVQNRAAGFAGALPSRGHVSGVVEESPGRLEYEVALFRESHARSDHSPNSLVEQAVPIGSKLQLRARINTQSAWKYAKLMGVTVSGDQSDPFSPGHVELIKEGCRQSDFVSIVPNQPQRIENSPGEVKLDFEAFMLDADITGSSKLWIHATIKACIEPEDCLPELCLDLFQPAGYGRRKRSFVGGAPPQVFLEVPKDDSVSLSYVMQSRRQNVVQDETKSTEKIKRQPQSWRNRTTEQSNRVVRATTRATVPTATNPQDPFNPSRYRKLADNVGVTVIMPEELFHQAGLLTQNCSYLLILCGTLGTALIAAAIFICYLSGKLKRTQIQTLQSFNPSSASSVSSTLSKSESKYPSVRYLLQ